MNFVIDKNKINTVLPKIMRASIRLFVRHGIDGTTTKDIAREAGVAEGALYRHFKSKEDLAWHIFQTHLDQFTAELMGKVLSHSRAEDRVRAFVEESFAAYESDPELFSYLILREHSELEKYALSFEHPGHLAMRIIEEGQKASEVRSGDPLILGSFLIGSIIRICTVKMYGRIKEDLREHSKDVAEGIWRMLRKEDISDAR